MSNMSNMTNLNVRLDSNVKEKAEELFKKLGLNMSTAINMFLRQSIREQRIPFNASMEVPNARLLKALEEADNINKDSTKEKKYEEFEEIIKDI